MFYLFISMAINYSKYDDTDLDGLILLEGPQKKREREEKEEQAENEKRRQIDMHLRDGLINNPDYEVFLRNPLVLDKQLSL